jgi:hypothetical protein
MDAATTPTAGAGWAVAAIVMFILLWIIPIFHALRGGRALPVIEVLLLLGAALLAVAAGVFTAGPPFVGSIFLVPMIGALGMLWFAALLIALAAELGETLRSPKPRYPPPRRVQEDDRYQ